MCEAWSWSSTALRSCSVLALRAPAVSSRNNASSSAAFAGALAEFRKPVEGDDLSLRPSSDGPREEHKDGVGANLSDEPEKEARRLEEEFCTNLSLVYGEEL